jgi:peptidoglycan/LPS O-acetylase OafA/YrhL
VAGGIDGPTLCGPAVSSAYRGRGDRSRVTSEGNPFRRDILGLRAVAILLVLLFHIDPSAAGGGRIGVDVFFVISGFVITDLLLRERARTSQTAFASFYAHRARRIIPMAALVILAVLVSERGLVGGIDSRLAADDARWSALFLGNVRIAQQFPTFLTATPASPLQTFWSLAVEEQFYLIYPLLFVALSVTARRWNLRTKLATGLSIIVAVSFTWSVLSTSPIHLGAYYSPFTRAWELAIGGLVAVGARYSRRLPRVAAASLTWLGLGAVVAPSFLLSASAALPGWLAAIPVLGTAFIIAGGTTSGGSGAVSLLRLPPFQYVGRWSYSLYLWQWPILIIYAEHWGPSTLADRYFLTGLALVLAALSYYTFENPLRQLSFISNPRAKTVASLGLGGLLICLCVGVATAMS